MFRRHRDVAALTTELPLHSVRVLRDDDELRAALERAREFERRSLAEYERRVGLYDRALTDPHGTPAAVHPIASERAAG
jgi:hypothetical protein